MSQCVPSWDVDDNPSIPAKQHLRSDSNPNAQDVPMLDYEVAELTWENGQLAMHGLGPPRVPTKPNTNNISTSTSTWEKPRASGTLESIVNQATRQPQQWKQLPFDELVPWFDHPSSAAAAASASATMTMDALVPCSNRTEDASAATQVLGKCMVGSCSVPNAKEVLIAGGKRARVTRVPEWSSRDHSSSGSATATFSREQKQQQHLNVDKCGERDQFGGLGFTSTSNFASSQDNTSSDIPCTKTHTATATATADENDSVCHNRSQKEAEKKTNGKQYISTKRSRAAAIHNQSERKRRDKINQRMKTLQKLVPNSSKTDKASMLDEVIEYLKQLQAQVQMMSRMNIQPMMLPIAMQQQLQMSMMTTPMSMGMGMGMGMGMAGVNVMDLNSIARSNVPFIHPSLFMPTWDAFADKLTGASSATVMHDPLSSFLASQPMTMDAYSRMALMYQQLQQQHQQQPPASCSKSRPL